MTSRRRRTPRKKPVAVSDFIREQLVVLVNLAHLLNGEVARRNRAVQAVLGPVLGAWRPEWAAEEQEATTQAAAVVEASLGTEYPTIPPAAAAAFDELAAGQPLEYTVRKINLRGPWLIRPDYRTPIYLVSKSARGRMAVWLSSYFRNPQRERLRRCQHCSRWFVDMTRNKSALR